jgi:hypothetical protein
MPQFFQVTVSYSLATPRRLIGVQSFDVQQWDDPAHAFHVLQRFCGGRP